MTRTALPSVGLALVLCSTTAMMACAQTGPEAVRSATGPTGACPSPPDASADSLMTNGVLNECAPAYSTPLPLILGDGKLCRLVNLVPIDKINQAVVFVNYVHGDGSQDSLNCSRSCVAAGWNYDDAINPAYIQLCAATCDALRQDPAGQLIVTPVCPKEPGDAG